MKKILFILVSALLISANSYGQGDVTISWLESEAPQAVGSLNVSSQFSFYMELDKEDLLNWKDQPKQIDSIKKVLFHLKASERTKITSCEVLLRQGTDLSTAAVVTTQTVAVNNLVNDWNTIVLDNPYKVDSSKRLFIGYKIAVPAGFVVYVANVSTSKQGWFSIGTDIGNFGSVGGIMKAVASTKASPGNEIKLTSLDIKDYVLLGDSVQIKGKIKNLGSDTLKTFTVSYGTNSQTIDTETFTSLNIKPEQEYSFAVTKWYVPTTIEVFAMNVTISNPNGIPDMETNNTLILPLKFKVYNNLTTERGAVLHEVFTSSTCPPCRPGNIQLTNILNNVDYNKWACVKYQYHFPGYGDPYYTTECGVRGDFYGGINSVPTLIGDGNFNKNPASYTTTDFNKLMDVPAAATMIGTATHDDQGRITITLGATINAPTTNLATNSDLRFFAAIVEKRTTKNIASNGETEFYYVFKKFMTSASGDQIEGLTLNAQKPVNYSYTFNGNYRLPANAQNPINNNTENSVENSKNLMVVYWLQDIVTKEVYQAGKAEPYPGIVINILEKETQNIVLSVYPNPTTDQLNIVSSVEFSKISIINMLGQTIKEVQVGAESHVMNVGDMAKGLYLIKVDTPEGSTIKKIQIQ